MEKLYQELAEIYNIMYQSFIDYDEEFAYYNEFLKKYNARQILEIGCGSGNMAKRILANNYNYVGLDISLPMLSIAKKQLPFAVFIQADMRNFSVENKFDAALIIGRSLSYILSMEDLMQTFNCVHKSLNPNGTFFFDVIDAKKFMPTIDSNKLIVHSMKHQNKIYSRESIFENASADDECLWNWHAAYYVKEPTIEREQIAKDNTTLRSFKKEEIELILTQCGFRVLEINERPSYAFDTLVFCSQKK